MMTIEQIKAALADRNIRKVAARSGVHEVVIYRFMSGKHEPRYATIKALSDYLEQGYRETLAVDTNNESGDAS